MQECYVCYNSETDTLKFIDYEVCLCKGSIQIHKSCLEKILETTNICGICKSRYKQQLKFVNGLAEVVERKNGYRTIYKVDTEYKKQGFYKIYYENKNFKKDYTYHLMVNKPIFVLQLHLECIYVDDVLQGFYREYHKPSQNDKIYTFTNLPKTTGSVCNISYFKDGLLHGECKYYYKNKENFRKLGNLCEESNYINGILNGVVKEYYKNGKIFSVKNYFQDLLHGEVLEYDESGNLITQAKYFYGVLI